VNVANLKPLTHAAQLSVW